MGVGSKMAQKYHTLPTRGRDRTGADVLAFNDEIKNIKYCCSLSKITWGPREHALPTEKTSFMECSIAWSGATVSSML